MAIMVKESPIIVTLRAHDIDVDHGEVPWTTGEANTAVEAAIDAYGADAGGVYPSMAAALRLGLAGLYDTWDFELGTLHTNQDKGIQVLSGGVSREDALARLEELDIRAGTLFRAKCKSARLAGAAKGEAKGEGLGGGVDAAIDALAFPLVHPILFVGGVALILVAVAVAASQLKAA